MNPKQIKNKGGKRPNSGRKLKYNEPTIPVSFRVPKSVKPKIVDIVNKELSKHKTI